ncbi:MAG: HPr family phosphocarrier protein [Eubacterium sp.]|nr:HPr family phosphocarrier protein [Eubacterium sp.]
MLKEEVTVRISSGLETRPIAMLVQIASRYHSRIQLTCGTRSVNAKSIMGMMSLGLDSGEQVMVEAEGPDEKDALGGICSYLAEGK